MALAVENIFKYKHLIFLVSCGMESSFLSFDDTPKVLVLTYLARRRLTEPKSAPASQVLCKSHEAVAELPHASGVMGRGRAATANLCGLLPLLGGHREGFPISLGQLQSDVPYSNGTVLLTQEFKSGTLNPKPENPCVLLYDIKPRLGRLSSNLGHITFLFP